MKIVELLEARPREASIMYHGTTSKYLRSIMINGLLANPPQKGFASYDDVWTSYDGGVYLTSDIKVAKDAAFEVSSTHGGEPIIVKVKYIKSSGNVDEDTVTTTIFADVYSAYDEQRKNYPNYKSFVSGILKNTSKKILDDIKQYGTITMKSVSILQKLIEEISAIIEKNIDHSHEYIIQDTVMMNSSTRELFKQFIDSIKVFDSLKTSTVRVRKNIGFKGSPRIVEIAKLQNNKVLYKSN